MVLPGVGVNSDSNASTTITTIAIVMSIVGYILTLIHRTQSSFNYGVSSSSGVLGLISDLFTPILTFIGSISGMPEWFNAIFTIPISIIVVIYAINRISI